MLSHLFKLTHPELMTVVRNELKSGKHVVAADSSNFVFLIGFCVGYQTHWAFSSNKENADSSTLTSSGEYMADPAFLQCTLDESSYLYILERIDESMALNSAYEIQNGVRTLSEMVCYKTETRLTPDVLRALDVYL